MSRSPAILACVTSTGRPSVLQGMWLVVAGPPSALDVLQGVASLERAGAPLPLYRSGVPRCISVMH